MIPTTNYSLTDDYGAADFLSLGVRELRKLRDQGKGPRCVTLPSGDIRYRLEDLQTWALGSRVLHVYDDSIVLPFPNSGVRVRRRLPPQRRRPSRELRRRPTIEKTRKAAKICLECEECLTQWEVEFCTSVSRFRTLSPRQRQVLDRITKKVHAYARAPEQRKSTWRGLRRPERQIVQAYWERKRKKHHRYMPTVRRRAAENR